ncbi:MAG: CPBP family intramembrane metalloprotease [Candidatus Eremiobacteraeota bacterium]|nr:CPBP family intramembrane metalloprotease [Candidatus Eremiobacteraeota bacterium]
MSFSAVCLVITFIGVSTQLQLAHGTSPSAHQSVVPLYLSTMIGEWFLLYFVWRGVRKHGDDLFAFSGRWKAPLAAVTDLTLGVIAAFGLLWLDALVQHLLGANPATSIDRVLPTGPLEITLWIALSITAGVVEELVYRAYLMRQLAARFRSLPFAVVAQGVWFAAMHAYEGLNNVLSIVTIGIALGLIAIWRKQLRTNIVAHTCLDLVGGLAPNLIRF